jgi:hypothetical protein
VSTASEWFDRIAALPDFPAFEERFGEHGQWCARHWAPCPLGGANGIGAAIELQTVFISEVASAPPPGVETADHLNAEMQRVGRLCCTLGDERMYEIWGHWPPAGPTT